jgi:hypothetical protein
MRFKFLLFFFLLSNCSLIDDSNFLAKDLFQKHKKPKKLRNFSENVSYSTIMTFEEFKIYLDDYTNKSKYPNINE